MSGVPGRASALFPVARVSAVSLGERAFHWDNGWFSELPEGIVYANFWDERWERGCTGDGCGCPGTLDVRWRVFRVVCQD